MGAAVRAQQAGFWVFPTEPNDKTPHYTAEPYRIKWPVVATNHLPTIVQLWTQWPDSNVGVAAKHSGLLIVDCDMPKSRNHLAGTRWEYLHDLLGPEVEGECVFEEVCERYGGNWAATKETYRVRTGSGGCHYYYRWPVGVQASQASIVNEILDIRCNGGEHGGYVLADGSVTRKGPYRAENSLPVIDCPAWLIEVCKDRPAPRVNREYENGGTGNYSGLVRRVEYAPEGDRNQCLLWAARAMCSDGADLSEAETLLGDAATVAGLRLNDAIATIRSGYRLQSRKG
jgi:hypothetical protein